MSNKTYRIMIPRDQEGFTQRECPSCGYIFGIAAELLSNDLFCPYCLHRGDQSEFHTANQIAYAQQEVLSQINVDVQKQLQSMMRGALRGSSNVKFRPSPISKQLVPQPEQVVIPVEIDCPSCKAGLYKVFGISSTCPFCGSPNTRILDANLEVIQKELSDSRELRHLYADIVTTFERESRFYAKGAKIQYQNLSSSQDYFLKTFQIDIFGTLEESETLSLKRVFEKRHVEQHNSGIIDERYIKNIPEDKHLAGKQATYHEQEALKAVDGLKKISTCLRILSKGIV